MQKKEKNTKFRNLFNFGLSTLQQNQTSEFFKRRKIDGTDTRWALRCQWIAVSAV